MHDQTRPTVLQPLGVQLGTARALVKGWSPLRWGLVVTIVLIAGFLGFSKLLAAWDRSPGESDEGMPVLVAQDYIPAFTVIRPAMIRAKDYPRAFVPPASMHSAEDLVNDKGLPKFVTTVPVPEGQPLTRAFLTEIDKRHGMASILPPGKVAVSFSVDRVHGVGGWIQPGDHIAIFQSVRETDSKFHSVSSTRLLLSSVLVIAVDESRIDAPVKLSKETLLEDASSMLGEGAVLSVLVNPPEASLIIQARDQSHLTAVLRPVGDDLPWPEDAAQTPQKVKP